MVVCKLAKVVLFPIFYGQWSMVRVRSRREK
jgi:hypothetical protein